MATKEEKGLLESLIAIQKKLKAPKDLYNKFGNYKYRSAESILEAVKPLLAENGVLLTITDEIVMIGTRYYVKSIATAQKDGDTRFGVGYAREDDSKKGMDGSQVTGASSSYARKYALNGLFLIDDTKDADTDEYLNQQDGVTKKDKQPAQTSQPAPKPYPPLDSEAELLAESEANQCNTSAELTAVWNKYTQKTSMFYHPNYAKEGGVFRKAVAARGQQLKSEGK